MPQEQIRVTVRMPREWRDAIVEQVLAEETTLTSWVCDHLIAALPPKVRKQLPAREQRQIGTNLLPTKKQEAGE